MTDQELILVMKALRNISKRLEKLEKETQPKEIIRKAFSEIVDDFGKVGDVQDAVWF